MRADPNIFRSYDIRGIYGQTIDESVAESIGEAYAEHVGGVKQIVVAHDVRVSSPQLALAFVRGASKISKSRIAFAGMLPLGTAVFHAWKSGSELAYVTASHLPKEWNGIKFFHQTGKGWMEVENFALRDRVLAANGEEPVETAEQVQKERRQEITTKTGLQDYLSVKRDGKLVPQKPDSTRTRHATIDPDAAVANYINHITKIKPKRPLRVVLDCGNGAASNVAPRLFKLGGFEVKALWADPDGRFPNRSPDPTSELLERLREAVRSERASLGIAYDGDGDRMCIVDNGGRVLSPEKVAYVLLGELLKAVQGPIVANVECTRVIDDAAARFKRDVIRVPVGHTHLMDAVHKNKAAFGVEASGHYCIPAIVPFDDALAISYYLACVVSRNEKPLDGIAGEIGDRPFGRINFVCEDDRKFGVIEKLKQNLAHKYMNLNDADGVRIDTDDGWVLIRASNTEPKIRLTVEADSAERFEEMKAEFSAILQKELNTLYKPSAAARLKALFGRK